jgi:hypothetical protein
MGTRTDIAFLMVKKKPRLRGERILYRRSATLKLTADDRKGKRKVPLVPTRGVGTRNIATDQQHINTPVTLMLTRLAQFGVVQVDRVFDTVVRLMQSPVLLAAHKLDS